MKTNERLIVEIPPLASGPELVTRIGDKNKTMSAPQLKHVQAHPALSTLQNSTQLTHSSDVMSTTSMTLLNHWAKFAERIDGQLNLLVNEPKLESVFLKLYIQESDRSWQSGRASFGKWKICIDITLHMGFNEICFQALEFECRQFSGITYNLSHSTTNFGFVETKRNEMFVFPILRWEKIFCIHKF